MSWDANVCPYCGHDYRATMAGAPAQKKESAMPLIGGILIIIASLGYFGIGALIAGGSAFAIDVGGGWGIMCGAVLIILGIIALLGGVFALQRKNFALALIGGIFVVPSILGLIGLILVAASKDEFKD